MDTSGIECLKQKIRENLDLSGVTMPEEIRISTMTMDAKLDVTFNASNIYNYIRTSEDGIQRIKSIKHTISKNTRKTTDTTNKRRNVVQAKKKRNTPEFLNQVTVFVNVAQKENGKPVSVKIFNNGTLHFTGVNGVASLLEATRKICEECKRERMIVTKTKDKDGNVVKKLERIKFVADGDEDKLSIENLRNFAVNMINCNFTVPFTIDRPKLQVSLASDGYNVTYDANGHSAVNIKYAIQNDESHSKAVKFRNAEDMGKNEERVTIFVFESGSIIIILGNQGFRPINEVYSFIYKYLLENYDTIIKDDDLTDSSIREYLDESECMNNVKIHESSLNSAAYKPKKPDKNGAKAVKSKQTDKYQKPFSREFSKSQRLSNKNSKGRQHHQTKFGDEELIEETNRATYHVEMKNAQSQSIKKNCKKSHHSSESNVDCGRDRSSYNRAQLVLRC